jgi:hypothetical protein
MQSMWGNPNDCCATHRLRLPELRRLQRVAAGQQGTRHAAACGEASVRPLLTDYTYLWALAAIYRAAAFFKLLPIARSCSSAGLWSDPTQG